MKMIAEGDVLSFKQLFLCKKRRNQILSQMAVMYQTKFKTYKQWAANQEGKLLYVNNVESFANFFESISQFWVNDSDLPFEFMIWWLMRVFPFSEQVSNRSKRLMIDYFTTEYLKHYKQTDFPIYYSWLISDKLCLEEYENVIDFKLSDTCIRYSEMEMQQMHNKSLTISDDHLKTKNALLSYFWPNKPVIQLFTKNLSQIALHANSHNKFEYAFGIQRKWLQYMTTNQDAFDITAYYGFKSEYGVSGGIKPRLGQVFAFEILYFLTHIISDIWCLSGDFVSIEMYERKKNYHVLRLKRLACNILNSLLKLKRQCCELESQTYWMADALSSMFFVLASIFLYHFGNLTKYQACMNSCKEYINIKDADKGTADSVISDRIATVERHFGIVIHRKFTNIIIKQPKSSRISTQRLSTKQQKRLFLVQKMFNETKANDSESKYCNGMIQAQLPILQFIENSYTFKIWNNITNMKQCHWKNCLKKEKHLKRCRKCRSAFYCSKKCQKQDWKLGNHRCVCKYYRKRKLFACNNI